ncbi:MAG: spore gernimation protein [Actinobacteria bacterium]|nr:spore gernimation protein [Actinomycetota bacterium]
MKAVALVGALALVLASCGSVDTAARTTTVDHATTSTTQRTTTSATTNSATTASNSTTTEPFAGPYDAIVYMLHDSGGSPTRTGPFLAPVSRNEASLEDTVLALLNGLTPSEIDLGITTAIPQGTDLNDVEVTDGVATVDLSSVFDGGGGTVSMRARLAQLVYTVTGYDPEITGVRLELDGTPVEVSAGEGPLEHVPMTPESFEDLLPGILIESPAFDDWAPPPVTITGIATAAEGVFQLEILDSDGNMVAAVPVQIGKGPGWRRFSVTFEASDLPPMPATLQIRVYEPSAKDGSVIYERIQPFGYRMNP